MSPPEEKTKQDRLRVLNLEDNPNDSELILAELETEWPQVEFLRVDTRDAFVRALTEFKPDLVLSDFRLPDMNGWDALKIVRQTHPHIPVIMVTGALGEIDAVDLVKQGAKDYVMKDHLQRLTVALQGALLLEQGIRARKSMERALQESEADLRVLVEHSPIAMIVDADEKIVMMNQQFTRLFGYTVADVPDVRHWWPLAYPDEKYREELKAEWICRVEKAIQSHVDIEPMEASVNCKDGAIRHVRISLASIGSRNIVTFEDLTERKRAETTLRESEEKFHAIFEGALDGVLLADAENKHFATGNPAICRMLGYSQEELARLGVADIHPQQDLPHVIEQFEGQLRGDIQLAENLPVKRKDGSVFYADIKSSAVKFGDKTYLVGVFRDITERKQAEAKIQRLNRLYIAQSHCNQAIVHSENEAELFAQTCAAAVQFGGFKMAWIGVLDPDTRMVKPVFSFGEAAEEYLHDIKISADAASAYGQGPTGRALRENQPFWCQDFLHSPLTIPWHERGAILGWRSSAALPLCREGVVFGALTLYSSEPNAFDEAARELLIEMSADINFALDNFRHDAERRQAEESLRKLSLAVEQSPNSIVITDLDANIEYVNENFVKVTGYSRAEVIGQNPRILHSGKNSRETYDAMWAHLTRGESWKGELINRRKDGSEYFESIFISPVRDADGRATHYLGIKEDITERKRVEKSLQESEEKFRVMSASAQDGIVMIDNDGNISFWNAAAEKIFGYTELEALGKNLHLLLTPARFHEASGKGFAHFQHSGEGALVGKTLELVALHQNGKEFPIELSLSAVNISGSWQAIGIVRDITERKQVEAQMITQYEQVERINAQLLESNKQLEQAQSQLLQSEKMAAIGLLAAGVAHEINNPVGYVNSNLGTLEKYLADIFVAMDKYEAVEVMLGADNPLLDELRLFKSKVDLNYIREDTKALLAESHQGLERVKKIVLDLKEFSHADSEDHWVLEDVHQGLESTLNVVWNELKYKCEVVKEYGTLPKIYHLPSQLNQVFMNLLVNAAQAIEVRGTITLRTGQEGDRIWIEVSDTGKGIPAANFPHLFDPFFTTKPVGKGTGLGLSVSYKIIEKHHGKIEVHSEVGKGSTFRVWLPVQQPETKETT